jgi:hypothetical protein
MITTSPAKARYCTIQLFIVFPGFTSILLMAASRYRLNSVVEKNINPTAANFVQSPHYSISSLSSYISSLKMRSLK